MLMDPIWLYNYGPTAFAAAAAVICGKTAIIYFIGRVLGINRRYALASGLTLSQIGEFSFVLTTTSHQSGLIGDEIFALVVTVNILSIFTAPYLVSYALPLADYLLRLLPQPYARSAQAHAPEGDDKHPAIIVIGYGPAGRQVSEALQQNGLAPGIIELNPAIVHGAADTDRHVHIGDATSTDVLIHAGVPDARAVIVTVPDPRSARDITAAVRALAPETHLLVRSRFQRASKDLEGAGATTVVDEEITVGRLLAHEVLTSLELGQDAGLACALAGRSPDVRATAQSDKS